MTRIACAIPGDARRASGAVRKSGQILEGRFYSIFINAFSLNSKRRSSDHSNRASTNSIGLNSSRSSIPSPVPR